MLVFVLAGCLDSRSKQCGDVVCPSSYGCDEASSTCIPPGCGDGAVNNDEQCDGDALGAVVDCTSLRFYDTNPVSCTVDCKFDTSLCEQSCGDHVQNGPELCDGDAPAAQSCLDYGYGTGRIGCAPGCSPGFDTCETIGGTSEATFTHSMHAIDGRAPDDGYAVGGQGSVLHYDGTAWTEMGPGSANTYEALWLDKSPTGKTIVAAGDDNNGHAAVAVYNGATWDEQVITTAGPLTGVWGKSATDVWAVGAMTTLGRPGFLIHFDGTSWGTPLTNNPLESLNAITGDPATGRIVAVGDKRTTVVFNGTAWEFNTNRCQSCDDSQYGLQAVMFLPAEGAQPAQFIATGTSPPGKPAVAQVSVDGGELWTAIPQTIENTTLTALSGVRGDVYASGSAGVLARYDGKTFHQVTTNTLRQLGGVWRAAADDVRVTFQPGQIVNVSPTVWLDAGPATYQSVFIPVNLATIRLADAAVSPTTGETIVVGNPSALWQSFDGRAWVPLYNGNGNGNNKNFTGVAFAPNGDGYVTTAASGEIFTRTVGDDAFIASPLAAGAQTTDVYAASNTKVYVSAKGGKVYVGSRTSTWTPQTVADSTVDLATVWGSGPNDVYVGGTKGFIAHSTDGATWTPITIDGFKVDVTSIWGSSATDVYAVGAKGSILHFDGTAWRYEHKGSEDLDGVFGIAGPAGRRSSDVIAVGPDVMFHYDGTSWAPLAPPVVFGSAGATAIKSTHNDILVVGTRGTMATLSRVLSADETRCDDGWDDDRDGLVDCADDDCNMDTACTVTGGSCRITGTIACNTTASGTTFTGFSRLDALPSTSVLTDGPEAVYRFTADATGSVTLALDTQAPLELVITSTYAGTSACNLESAVGARSGAGELTFDAVEGASYSVIIDEPAGKAGDFTLTAACD